MTGGFVLVVGPSGAGKDTLIRLARDALAGDPRFVFPRRLVTRPPSAHEDNAEIAEEDFARGAEAGAFALSWRAHGLGYAIPAETLAAVREGRCVVCNVSRRVVAEARRALPGVRVVNVTAAPEILAARLAARGRAEDGDLGARLAREAPRAAPTGADLTLVNEGAPAAAGARLVAFLRQAPTSSAAPCPRTSSR
ncbi:phosphonate metabolism protein/1,5-bisphosphokinase (PRPP-forming) PhnN [Methylobacterium sp. NEAU 140]|uniref:phosphonate metabolism protein/1,5-bisphosphokinase (PRPP-forming) PhnN n=1 Tax=Methylobacterium sp. NEAU 140 TaxID=3064945 RepID=UPI0027363F45|nr:phosphonate metabolism protein/1,5-bisphosphokinase (PRPP-forming) PhnN [Methylobacterium sp. NEAU 140]MDP4021965.1 phosphonate metabolism protein/1,5-bisphosphokinase (PRPP-forming) PhnN [Methylobacterium sp. NEAU 140]